MTTADQLHDVHTIRETVELALNLGAPLTLDLNGATDTVRGDDLRAEWDEFDMGNWFSIDPGIPALLAHARDAAEWVVLESLVQRRAHRGATTDGSAALLAELLTSHSGDNLVHALTYNDFATAARAERFAATR